MSFLKPKFIQEAKSVLFALFIGALCTPFWEYILKPLWSFARNWVLNITTLGVTGYKNAVYVEISQGFCEKSSVLLLCLLIGVLPGWMLGVIVSSGVVNRLKNESVSDRKIKTIKYVSILYAIVLSVAALCYSSRVGYVNSSITYFQQLRSIISPYIHAEKEKSLNSQFSQVDSRSTFLDVIYEMETIAKEHNLKVPKFKAW